MKKLSLALAYVALAASTQTVILAQTQIIAHRGYWNCDGSAQNSIESLRNSAKIGVYGSEFDVVMTKDGVLVVNHDDEINGIDIQRASYAEIKDQRISNDEIIPTLEEYLIEGKKHPQLKLILELKPHRTKKLENRAVNETIRLIEKHGVESQVEFISFSKNICKEVAKLTLAPVSYVKGNIHPNKISKYGIDGIDYHFKVFIKERDWIADANKLNLLTNSWTINDQEVAKSLISQGIDYLTTDYPEELTTLIEHNKCYLN